jgi:hypothetical protein
MCCLQVSLQFPIRMLLQSTRQEASSSFINCLGKPASLNFVTTVCRLLCQRATHGILAGRRHPFSLVLHAPPTSAEYNKWDSSTLAVSDVDPRSAASNRWGTVFAAFQRAPPRSSKSDCSTVPHALGGLHHLQAFSQPHSDGYII